MSLLERILIVLEDKGWSGTRWAREAGLSERTHVNTLMNRLKKNAEAKVDTQTLAKMADAAGVSLDWLALGRGTKDGAFIRVEQDPTYPSRAVAIAAATIAGWNADGIDRVRRMSGFASDPGLEVWMGLLRSESEGIKRLPPPSEGGPSVPAKRLQARKRG